jgi:hypothetical protein
VAAIIHLAALFVDAVFLAVRPDGPKEGVLVAWGFTEDGERVLLAVMLGMRESHEDWLELGRDLISRGRRAPMLIVADGAPGLIKAIEQCRPASDRQHCAVHRLRNLLAKLPNANASAGPTGRRKRLCASGSLRPLQPRGGKRSARCLTSRGELVSAGDNPGRARRRTAREAIAPGLGAALEPLLRASA